MGGTVSCDLNKWITEPSLKRGLGEGVTPVWCVVCGGIYTCAATTSSPSPAPLFIFHVTTVTRSRLGKCGWDTIATVLLKNVAMDHLRRQ